VTGRIASGPQLHSETLFHEIKAYHAFHQAGYLGRWALTAQGWAGPKAAPDSRCKLEVLSNLELGPLTDEESAIRGFSDDQNIVVGHASGSEETGWLPPAVFAARRLREALGSMRETFKEVCGPDGKVLVRILAESGTYRLDILNVSLQHAPEIGYEALHRILLPALEAEVKALDLALPGIGGSWNPDRFRLNGGGDFTCGGPRGDNGLSGKKLVVDHYGPGVPIGGGALCGKDPHKVDRAGALRARELAVRIVRDTDAKEATVRLGFLPGMREPAFLEAQVDGVWNDSEGIARLVAVPDLSIEGTVLDLGISRSRWSKVVRAGYFGRGLKWEE
jgi:S-adenosylmethionine synthetase